MLRSSLTPKKPQSKKVKQLASVIALIESAFEAGNSTDELMAQHDQLTMRHDIKPERYEKLYSSMSCEDAAREALMPVARKVDDIARDELEAIAGKILNPEHHYETSYYLELFELNTPSGNSDLFYWPNEDWLKKLGTDDPSLSQIVDKALEPSAILLD